MNAHRCSWELVNAAVGSDVRDLHLDTSFGHTGMNRVGSDGSPGSSIRSLLRVSGFALDAVLDFYGVDNVDLIKIDVEGYELEVLMGLKERLKQKKVRKILLEVTDDYLRQYAASKSALYEFLAGFGYLPVGKDDRDWQYDELFAPS